MVRRSGPLRLAALGTHGVSLGAYVGWCLTLSAPSRFVALGLVLATGLLIARALITSARSGLQRSAVLLVLYVGLATLEVVASQRGNRAAIVALYASLVTLGLVLAMLKRARTPPRESTE